jgi:hypothetical protein
MTVHSNPFAAIDDRAVWADMSAEERAVVAEIGAMYEHADPATLPDPAYLAAQRRLFVDLCVVYAAGNTAGDLGDWYVDPSACASTWLNAIADHAYAQEAGQ